MNDRVFDIVVLRWCGYSEEVSIEWRRADEVFLHDAQTELLVRGSRMEILGHYRKTTIEQRIAIVRAARALENNDD
jgi:hypothetical protein